MGQQEQPAISDEAVRDKTGKDWAEWLAVLDAAGAQAMSHKEIVALLAEKYDLSGWWQQTVTVTYEQARGLRQKYETAAGFQAGASKTVNVPLAALYRAWDDESARGRWLPDAPITVRKATENKSMRLNWGEDGRVEVYFSSKGDNKSAVQVQQTKLNSAEEVAAAKSDWSAALTRLKALLEN